MTLQFSKPIKILPQKLYTFYIKTDKEYLTYAGINGV